MVQCRLSSVVAAVAWVTAVTWVWSLAWELLNAVDVDKKKKEVLFNAFVLADVFPVFGLVFHVGRNKMKV